MKVIDADSAAKYIPDGATVAISGCSACAVTAERVYQGLEKSFLETGKPCDLTLFHPQGQGDKDTWGCARFAHKGMVRRCIGGHWGMANKMGELAVAEELEGYNLPQGVMAMMMRAMCEHGPGVITKIGLGTFVDPRLGGGKMNERARQSDDLVELMTIDGEEWLRYKPVPIDVAIIRGTTADDEGYITMEDEPLLDEMAAMAAAAHNNGGIVIAQVKYLAKKGTLDARNVKVPGYLVDYVVVEPESRQAYYKHYDPSYCGALQTPIKQKWPEGPLDVRKFIARRQAMELHFGEIVNVGAGISQGIPTILDEEGLSEDVIFSIEQGMSGGVPLMGLDAGTMVNPRVILDQPTQMDMYHGGVLDIACLSAAETDFNGNVNVSKLGNKITGSGGFIDIAQETKRIIFGGTLCAKSKCHFENGRVVIDEQGKIRKFVNEVQQITFSGDYAKKRNKYVLFVTERCVFRLMPEGLTLIEIAPGIDLEKDILAQMDFRPLISKDLKLMPKELFNDGPMGLREIWSQRKK